ncbi:serine protease [Prosthecobacter sp.]|uniref:S1C family serine protease n=1 Tax=Prosthecobacter sp. TaxID=1965333 RepID=UPI001D8D65F3|nr:serine protease [Prosthecobacter sp.]MCB1277165.1 trypsin-like peptidase domain-containing protein [Prosthecobacter sp.]
MNAAQKIQVSRDGSILGEHDHDEIVFRLNQGAYKITDHYWQEGMSEWRQLVDFIGSKPKHRSNSTNPDHKRLAVGVCAAIGCMSLGAGLMWMVLAPQKHDTSHSVVPEHAEAPTSVLTDSQVRPESEAISSSTPKEPKAMQADEVYSTVAPSVVLIKSIGADNRPLAFGSGFAISDGKHIVTNRHVIEGASKIEIVFADGTSESPQKGAISSSDQDIAIVEVTHQQKAIPWTQNPPKVGNQLFAIGNPKGLKQTLSNGILSGIRDEKGLSFYQMTTPISPGSSGGPVVNEFGQLVGMATFYFEDGQNLNFAVRSQDIQRHLEGAQMRDLSTIIATQESSKFKHGSNGIDVDVLGIKEGYVVISAKNSLKSTVRAMLLRLIYFELPDDSEYPVAYDKPIAVIKDYCAKQQAAVNDLSDSSAKLTTLLRLLQNDGSRMSDQLLAQIKVASDAIPGSSYQLGITGLELDAEFFLQSVNSQNPYTRQSVTTRYLPKLNRSIIESKAKVEERLKTMNEQVLLGKKMIADAEMKLKQFVAVQSEKAASFKKTYADAQKRVVHYEDVSVVEDIAPGLVKQIGVMATANEKWGIEAHVLDHLTARSTN